MDKGYTYKKMSDLREGDTVSTYGMILTLTKPYTRAATNSFGTVYGFTGVIENLEEVRAGNAVPNSYVREGTWTVQGNDMTGAWVKDN